MAAGVLLGLAVVFKYNAVAYVVPLVFAGLSRHADSDLPWTARWRSLVFLAAGALVVPMLTVAHFVYHGAFDDFFLATVTYNVRYSGETYHGPLHALSYLLTFPIGYARLDPLWLVGGAGCAGLLFFGIGNRALWLPVAWVAAACLSIAINGSRGLPQYFVQAASRACAGGRLHGCPAVEARRTCRPDRRRRAGRDRRVARRRLSTRLGLHQPTTSPARLAASIATPISLATAAPTLATSTRLSPCISSRTICARTRPIATVCSSSVSRRGPTSAPIGSAHRASSGAVPSSWALKLDRARYGVAGLLDELEASRPRIVVLQHRDWDPDGLNSDQFWRTQPSLVAWLTTRYVKTTDLHNFEIWTRQAPS